MFESQTYYYVFLFSSSWVIFVLGILLLGIRIPKREEFMKMRSARIYMAISYLILAGLQLLNFAIIKESGDNLIQTAFTLFIASSQALLFTMTLLAFIQPLFVHRKRILWQIATIIAFGIVLFTTLILFDKKTYYSVFLIATAAYAVQLLRYIVVFRQNYKKGLQQLESYYEEEDENRLSWLKISFYQGLGIGILAMIFLFIDLRFNIFFILIYTAYYTLMIHRLCNYLLTDMQFIAPAIARQAEEPESNKESDEEDEAIRQKEALLKSALESWVAEKRFRQSNVGVAEIAEQLGTTSVFLRFYFNRHMPQEFRTWRSELRIREAQSILKEHPKMSLNRIAELVGFNHRANFHHQFLKITGIAPSDYKKEHLGKHC